MKNKYYENNNDCFSAEETCAEANKTKQNKNSYKELIVEEEKYAQNCAKKTLIGYVKKQD